MNFSTMESKVPIARNESYRTLRAIKLEVPPQLCFISLLTRKRFWRSIPMMRDLFIKSLSS